MLFGKFIIIFQNMNTNMIDNLKSAYWINVPYTSTLKFYFENNWLIDFNLIHYTTHYYYSLVARFFFLLLLLLLLEILKYIILLESNFWLLYPPQVFSLCYVQHLLISIMLKISVKIQFANQNNSINNKHWNTTFITNKKWVYLFLHFLLDLGQFDFIFLCELL